MIPALLPSPRADVPANAHPMEDDHGFDDALRRAAGTGTTAGSSETEHRPTRDAAGADGEARTAPTGAGSTVDQPPAGEPPGDPEPVREDETDDVAAPAATVVAPAAAPPTGALMHGPHVAVAGEATAGGTSSGIPATGTAAVSAVASDEVPAAPTPELDGDAGGSVDVAVDPVLDPETVEPSGEAPDAGVGASKAESLGARSGTGPDGTGGPAARRDAPVAPALTGVDASSATAPPVTDDVRPVTASPDGDVAPALDAAAAPASHAAAPADRAAAPAPTPAGPPVATQLVEHVAPLVEGPDGTHELTIELRPATLGRVELEVTLEDGVLHVRVHADDPASRRLLGQSLGELRTALADAGISAGNLDVGDPGSGGARTADDGARADRGPDGRSTTGGRAAASSPSRAPADDRAGLDVLL